MAAKRRGKQVRGSFKLHPADPPERLLPVEPVKTEWKEVHGVRVLVKIYAPGPQNPDAKLNDEVIHAHSTYGRKGSE